MEFQIKQIPIKKSWKKVLIEELCSPYMKEIEKFLIEQMELGKTIYPEQREIFSALNYIELEQVKVVIIGQDPYHGPGQAHGLSFSVRDGVKVPPSLKNIYREIEGDLGHPPAAHGFLGKWAEQGVLLLNAVLTVEQKKAGSHNKIVWQKFTDKIIEVVNKNLEGVVFILWGSYAQKKSKDIDASKHLVIESVHPSPLSAYRGFFGSKPFSRANKFLLSQEKKVIDWELSH